MCRCPPGATGQVLHPRPRCPSATTLLALDGSSAEDQRCHSMPLHVQGHLDALLTVPCSSRPCLRRPDTCRLSPGRH